MRRSALAAALMLSLAAVAMTTGAALAASGSPPLVNGKKAGPVAIQVTQKTVATLPLTKGRWLVLAKAVLVGSGGTEGMRLGVDCRLSLGSRSDRISAAPTPQQLGGSRVPILLTVAGRLSGAGSARVRCAGDVGGAVKIRDIRVTATKVGKLTTRATLSPSRTTTGPSATSGSGRPVVISATQGSARSVPGDGTYHPVASVPLSPGRWLVVGKGVAFDGGASAGYRCRISTVGDSDIVRFPLGSPGGPGDTTPFTFQVAQDLALPDTALLECQGDAAFKVRNAVINAVKVGRLSIIYRPGPAVTTGSGNPRVIAAWSDDPIEVPVADSLANLVSLPLPKGKWLVVAKASFVADGVPADSVERRVACQLGFSGYKDDAELRYQDDPSRVGVIVLQVPASTSTGTSAVLRCRRTEAGGSGELTSLKISALKLRSILAWKL